MPGLLVGTSIPYSTWREDGGKFISPLNAKSSPTGRKSCSRKPGDSGMRAILPMRLGKSELTRLLLELTELPLILISTWSTSTLLLAEPAGAIAPLTDELAPPSPALSHGNMPLR